MITRDSSIWQPVDAIGSILPGVIKMGMIISSDIDPYLGTVTYLVEVHSHARRYTLNCQQLVKHGNPYDYEQYTLKSNQTTINPLSPDVSSIFSARSGEMVVVAELQGSEGIILGCLKHPTRPNIVPPTKNEYISVLNGIRTDIKEDGSYKITFNGKKLPVVDTQLKAPQMTNALNDAVIYDKKIAGSFLAFDEKGSFEINDSSLIDPQSLKIDKSAGSIKITSGTATITIEKKTQKITIENLETSISSKKSFKVSSADIEANGTKSIKIKSPKIAIGFGGVELIDSIVKLIDGLGLLIITSPVGPCSPINTAPTWAPQIETIKAKLTLIKGSL